MDRLHNTAERTTLHRSCDDGLTLDPEDMETVGGPVVGDVSKDDAEADERSDVGDTCACCVRDSALNWRKYSSTTDLSPAVS